MKKPFAPRHCGDSAGPLPAPYRRPTGIPTICSYNDLRLHSVFQPIFSFANQQPVGYEGLVRATRDNGEQVAPLTLFDGVPDLDQQIALDRLCRKLHMANFVRQAPEDTWLFLNVSPQVCVDGPRHSPFFAEQLQRCELPSHRVVVEIVENAIEDEQALLATVNYYKELGCLVALDDFGTGHSNFNRVWTLQPDIVKLDRSIIRHASQEPRVRRSLPNLVAMLHEAGSLVLAEGVQTESEAEVAMEADIDLLQGYLFAKPGITPYRRPDVTPVQLCERWRSREAGTRPANHNLQSLLSIFSRIARAIADGASFDLACRELTDHPGVNSCYLLDDSGSQLAECPQRPDISAQGKRKFSPLQKTQQSSWYRRPYFKSAMSNPGQVQVSRPYLSLTAASMCVTLSLAFTQGDRQRVLCCDMDDEVLQDRMTGVA